MRNLKRPDHAVSLGQECQKHIQSACVLTFFCISSMDNNLRFFGQLQAQAYMAWPSALKKLSYSIMGYGDR